MDHITSLLTLKQLQPVWWAAFQIWINDGSPSQFWGPVGFIATPLVLCLLAMIPTSLLFPRYLCWIWAITSIWVRCGTIFVFQPFMPRRAWLIFLGESPYARFRNTIFLMGQIMVILGVWSVAVVWSVVGPNPRFSDIEMVLFVSAVVLLLSC